MGASGCVHIVPGRDHRGEYVFSVLVKRTYRITPGAPVERSEEDHPFRLIDEYYDGGDPEWSTVQHESEVAPYKPATDVVVIGKAYAPGGQPVQRMEVGVKVGERKRTLVVTGDRHCHFCEGQPPIFGEPEEFAEMEIRYDRAYGGRDEKSLADIPFLYPRNFMGTGVVLRNLKESVEGLRLPNIEDPQNMLEPDRLFIGEPDRWHLQPLPLGFGWRQRAWYPRAALLGAYPPFLDPGTVTPEEAMGLLPKDHVALAKQSRLKPLEAAFGNGASIGLIFSELGGDESITLTGMTAEGVLEFSLPGETPKIALDLGPGPKELEPKLHTVSIRPDDREVDVIWRGAQGFGGYRWLTQMTRLHAEVA